MVIWGEGTNDSNNSREIDHYGVFAENMAKFSEVETGELTDDTLFLGADQSDRSRTFSFKGILTKLKTLLAEKIHKHSADDITSGTLPVSRGGTGKSTALTAADVGAASSGHEHSAADVTSGILPVARGGTGKGTALTADDVGAASSDHKHSAADVTSGILPVDRGGTGKSTALTAADVGAASSGHKHSAADVTSGILPVARGGTGKGTALTAADVGAASSGHKHSVDDVNGAAPKESPSFTGSISMSRREGSKIGNKSVAVGNMVEATGDYSNAEGDRTYAVGLGSHAGGVGTHSQNSYSYAIGHFNKEMTTGGTYYNEVGDAFVIGNGINFNAGSNAFRVTFEGIVYGKGAFQTSGADYAEFFEWADENPEGQDRIGRFVTLDGKKIKVAEPGDYILGIISGNPCIVGNADEDWLGRWVHDDFGRFVKEYLEKVETEIQRPDGLTDDELPLWMMENRVEERDGKYIQTTTVVVDHETASWRHKANPEYDHTQPYIERKDRKEWDYVGMMGVLAVWDDGTCQVNGFCKVAEGGIATAAEGYVPGLTYRVIERVADNIIKVVFR